MVRYVEVAPASDLSEWVDCFWSITGRIESGVRGNRVLPDGCMDVLLRFGDPPVERGSGSLQRAIVVGAMTAPAVVWQAGHVDLMGVRYRPGGAHAFLSSIPASEFTDAIVPLDSIWQDAHEVYERAAGCSPAVSRDAVHDVRSAALGAREQLRARARIVETILRRRVRDEADVDQVVAAAVRLISDHEGGIRIDELERRLGVTQRSLERRFRSHTGLSPKVAARIARFQRAASVLQQAPDTPLARLAAERGYHDQSHMTREFRALAGLPPAAYAVERVVGFVQDE